MKKTLQLAAVTMVLLTGETVRANFITNGGFDTDLSGWTYLPWVNNSWGGALWFADNGGSAGIWGDNGMVNEGGYIYQDNGSHPFQMGETYTVSFDVATLGGGVPQMKATLFDTTAGQAVASLTVDPPLPADNSFVSFSFNYDVEASRVGNNWRFDFSPLTWGGWSGLDNVSVTATAVPEPSALLLLGTSLIGLVTYSRRKRK